MTINRFDPFVSGGDARATFAAVRAMEEEAFAVYQATGSEESREALESAWVAVRIAAHDWEREIEARTAAMVARLEEREYGVDLMREREYEEARLDAEVDIDEYETVDGIFER